MLLSNNGRKIIECIPIEQILIESDAPFTKGLASTYSIDFEDKIYNYLAEKNGYTVNELSQIIKNNFRRILT